MGDGVLKKDNDLTLSVIEETLNVLFSTILSEKVLLESALNLIFNNLKSEFFILQRTFSNNSLIMIFENLKIVKSANLYLYFKLFEKLSGFNFVILIVPGSTISRTTGNDFSAVCSFDYRYTSSST